MYGAPVVVVVVVVVFVVDYFYAAEEEDNHISSIHDADNFGWLDCLGISQISRTLYLFV